MTSNLPVLSRDWAYPVREQRSSLENPQTTLSYPAEWLLDIFNGGRTDAGVRVSEMTAFQIVTFLSCVDLIAGKVSSLPWHVYERQAGRHGRAINRIAYEHSYYDLVSLEPNEEMSWQTFLYAFLCHSLAWEGAYAEIQRDGGNAAVAFWPRNPAKTRPVRLAAARTLPEVPWRPFPVTIAAGELAYETTDGVEQQNSGGRIIPAADMIAVPGMSFDGRLGQSVVQLARNTLGQVLAMEKFGSKYFANFAKPGGLLIMPANLSKEDKDTSKKSWQEAQGGENMHRTAVMPPGFDYKPMSHNSQEAQAKEMREFLRTEVAALFHVPSRMVGDTATKTRGSTEQENQELLDFALSPRITAIRQEYKRKVFPNAGVGRRPKNPYFLGCDTWEMLRGDSASREKFYASGKQWAYANTNDIRVREGFDPIQEDWAEQFWMPVNMTLVTTPVDPTHACEPAVGAASVEPVTRAYGRVFEDAFHRVVAREKRDSALLQRCFAPVCYALRDLCGGLAARDLGVAAGPGVESERFVGEFLAGLTKRASSWTTDQAATVCAEELGRAARGIRVAVYRELAAAKAKSEVVA
jgi:HK97 family phage portal protein